jgi:peptidoglycan hydrolase-like protein with peptidoglycan-binding domain
VRRRTWALGAAAVLAAAAATADVALGAGAEPAVPAAQDAAGSAITAKVERGTLSAMVSQNGILTYRGRSDGSPYAVINQAAGVYTKLPESGDQVGCGGVLYRVDDAPVVLLCGTVPAYRDLHAGDTGRDVRQLNANLHRLGYDAGAGVDLDPGEDDFTSRTAKALRAFQRDKGFDATGDLAIGDAVFLAEPVRIAKVTGEPGGPARAGAPVLTATSGRLQVMVALDPAEQGDVRAGDRARITLPGNASVTGRVEGFGRVAEVEAGSGAKPADATVPTYIGLDDPAAARGFDSAPVAVDITTTGVENALSVPVTALVGRSGSGFGVEVVRAGGRRELVAVELGLFDTTGGRVQVEGALHPGDDVVVPAA